MSISNHVLQNEVLSKEVNKQNQHTQRNKYKTRKYPNSDVCVEKGSSHHVFYPLFLFLDLTVSQTCGCSKPNSFNPTLVSRLLSVVMTQAQM